MTTRICEYCFKPFATSSEIVAHYQKTHEEEEELTFERLLKAIKEGHNS